MTGKHILIVSAHELFREGLKRILAETIDLASSIHTTSLQEAEELLGTRQIDAVIVDRSDEGGDDQALSRLLSYPGVRVITVKLDSGDLWIYRQERVLEASVTDLVTALTD